MLTCIKCGTGVEKYAKGKQCRECYNAYMATYMLERYHRRRAKAVELLGGKCVRCGATEELEFDHIERGLKSGEVAKWFTQGEAKLKAELVKCQLLCRPCHIEKTRSEMTVGHGGGVSGIAGCKCELCKLKYNEYMRNWKRERRKAQKMNARDASQTGTALDF